MKFNFLKNNEKKSILNKSDNKRTQEKSTGRSMVEMLGVLAIIGVLSIGGIQGYTISMRRYKANEILDAVNKYAMAIYSSCLTQIENESVVYGSSVAKIDENGNWYCKRLEYSQMGLGALPKDVNIDSICDSSHYCYIGSVYSAHIVSKEDGDYVTVPVGVKDINLCYTLASITGQIVGTTHTQTGKAFLDTYCDNAVNSFSPDRSMREIIPITIIMN